MALSPYLNCIITCMLGRVCVLLYWSAFSILLPPRLSAFATRDKRSPLCNHLPFHVGGGLFIALEFNSWGFALWLSIVKCNLLASLPVPSIHGLLKCTISSKRRVIFDFFISSSINTVNRLFCLRVHILSLWCMHRLLLIPSTNNNILVSLFMPIFLFQFWVIWGLVYQIGYFLLLS